MKIRIIKGNGNKLNNQPLLVTGETDNSYFIWVDNIVGTLCVLKEDCEVIPEKPIKPILKPFTFEEWNKDRSQPVWTSGYEKVEQLTYFNIVHGEYPFSGVVNGHKRAFTRAGLGNYTYILMLESKEKEYHVNVYKDGNSIIMGTPSSTKEQCDEYAKKNSNIYIKTISFKC